MLATREVPEPDRSVIAATGQQAFIGTELEGLYRPLMGFSHPYALPAVNIPPAQSAITASTEQACPTRIPGQRIYASDSLAPCAQSRSLPRIPDADLTHSPAPTPAREPPSLCALCVTAHVR